MLATGLTWSGGARSETAPDARSLLELATIGGAEVVGMASEIGTLSVGKRADLQIIRLDSLNLAGFGGGDPSALLVHSAHPSDVDTVIIGGRVVKIDGDLVDVDRPKLLQDAEGSARALTSRVAERD
ncbi:amidohydrolase family protein [Stenotrophomonas sp. C1657]|uniref:amidohydrolase family protein n=1 Tax=Stenotrophomonas sp. C1657 TaxID=3077844 RepID=UPI0035A07B2D